MTALPHDLGELVGALHGSSPPVIAPLVEVGIPAPERGVRRDGTPLPPFRPLAAGSRPCDRRLAADDGRAIAARPEGTGSRSGLMGAGADLLSSGGAVTAAISRLFAGVEG